MSSADHRIADLTRRLDARTEELAEANRRLASIDSTIELLNQTLRELRAETGDARAQRAELERRIDALTLHNDGLQQALAEREQTVGEQRRRILALEDETAHADSLEDDLRELTEHLVSLERDRTRTIEDLRRVAGSRAWRWGHGATRLLRAIMLRPMRKRAGGVEAILARLDSTPSLSLSAQATQSPPALSPGDEEQPAGTQDGDAPKQLAR